MAEQIPFEYKPTPSADFVEGVANLNALEALRRPLWPSGRLAIIGAPQSGKTAMAQSLIHSGTAAVGTAEGSQKLMSGHHADLLVIDNFKRFIASEGAEEAFFHLLNRTQETGQKVVIFARVRLDEIDIELPDLRSRLGTFEQFEIGMPDDRMVMQLLAKGFEQRGILVKPDVLEYLSKRVGRSYEEINAAINTLDQTAMRDQGKVNKARARAYLDSLEGDK